MFRLSCAGQAGRVNRFCCHRLRVCDLKTPGKVVNVVENADGIDPVNIHSNLTRFGLEQGAICTFQSNLKEEQCLPLATILFALGEPVRKQSCKCLLLPILLNFGLQG